MGEKDIQGKRLEDKQDVFADIVNVTDFHGVQLVLPDSLVAGPTVSLHTLDDGTQREQIRDVLKYCGNLGAFIMLLGIENQSAVDYDMVFRVMRYDGASYWMQRTAKEKYPVITTVLYFGMDKWNAPRSIHEAIMKDIPEWNRIIEVVPLPHQSDRSGISAKGSPGAVYFRFPHCRRVFSCRADRHSGRVL